MKTIKIMPFLMIALIVVLMASCGPGYVGVGTGGYGGYGGYGYRPYSGYGYSPYRYGYGYRPPVVIRPRYYSPSPRNYGGGVPRARGGYGGGGFGGGGRSRGPR